MDADREMLRLWNLVSDITEQLNENRAITARLLTHAGLLQEQAGQASDGATLRRFNTDVSKEHFTTELERFSVALVMENQSLLHENKQLNSLMQEYEQTLETVMGKLRGHCAAQTHQLTLSRHYETLLSRDRLDDPPAARGMDAEHLKSLLASIRRVLRSMQGKDPLYEEKLDREAEIRGDLPARLQSEEQQDQDENENEDEEGEEDGERTGMNDWTIERENEIRRLERENALMRHALGISVEQERELGLEEREVEMPAVAPLADRLRASPLRDDRGRGSGRLPPVGPFSAGNAQRRSAPPNPARRPFTGGGGEKGSMMPERVTSPPNDIRWEPVVESI